MRHVACCRHPSTRAMDSRVQLGTARPRSSWLQHWLQPSLQDVPPYTLTRSMFSIKHAAETMSAPEARCERSKTCLMARVHPITASPWQKLAADGSSVAGSNSTFLMLACASSSDEVLPSTATASSAANHQTANGVYEQRRLCRQLRVLAHRDAVRTHHGFDLQTT